MVLPDGRIGRTTATDAGFHSVLYNFISSPCYANENEIKWYEITENWAKYPSPRAAIRAMKKYGRDVAYLGAL